MPEAMDEAERYEQGCLSRELILPPKIGELAVNSEINNEIPVVNLGGLYD